MTIEYEFQCCECNRYIIAFVGLRPEPPLCGHCLNLPGWYEDPIIFRMLSGVKTMKLSHVTFTGADHSVRPEELLYLSRHYLGMVEWGILISRNRWGTPRYPALEWINELQKLFKGTPHRLALHVCGHYLRQILVGVNELPPELVEGFQRIQLNFHGQALKFDVEACVEALAQRFEGKEIIFQIDGAMGEDFLAAVEDGRQAFHCVPLFDLSHGSGRMPSVWPTVGNWSGNLYGYAGGLGPQNLAEQLPRIELAAGGEGYWVDMETRVRSEDGSTFDLNAVRQCCDIAHRFINPPAATDAPAQEKAS